MLLTGNVSIEPWCTRAAVGLPVPLEMMPWWRRWGWSVRHQKRTVHIIFIGVTSALCFHQKYATINQSINIFIAHSQLSIIIYYTAKNRAPKFYAGLIQILCWEPGGLPSFKVSGDPWITIYFVNIHDRIESKKCFIYVFTFLNHLIVHYSFHPVLSSVVPYVLPGGMSS